MNILSVQSHVVYGHVGNAAAVFALQRLGCEVWPIHTVQLSNHTGYGAWKGKMFSASHIGEVVEGLGDLGVLGTCDGVLSGYLGSVATGAAILDAVGRVKSANAGARYCCDPVIGSRERGTFAAAGILEFMRDRALPAADVITPNHFELDRLAGRDTASCTAIVSAIERLHASGPGVILVTSVRSDHTPDNALDVIASGSGGRYLVRTPKLATPANGAGDLIAALFLFHLLRGAPLAEAMAAATSAVFGVLRKTVAAAAFEMLLVEAQQEIVAPTETFAPQPFGF
jgi:pyridoxine kinase